MSDVPHERALAQLSGPELRLSAVLSRPRRIALGCIAALAGLGWAALGLMAVDANIWLTLCRPLGEGGATEFALLVGMWAAMVLAMMLPTAGPMILTYAEIAETAARKGEPAASPLTLAAGYVAVWLGFAMIASALQAALTQAELIDAGRAAPWLAVTIVLAAGLYQFSSLKHACLTQCQRPFPFFFAHWTSRPGGMFRLGLRQGLACLGCCVALMLLMFAAGMMNVLWMAALGIVMTVEKMTDTPLFARAVGAVLVAVGLIGVLAMGVGS